MTLRFRLLGRVGAVRLDGGGPAAGRPPVDGPEVDLGGPLRRGVLAVLLLEAGAQVSWDLMARTVWADAAPHDPAAALQKAVHFLRRTLEPDVPARRSTLLVRVDRSYRVELGDHQLDLHDFAALATAGTDARRHGDASAAHASLGAALELWRGTPLLGLPDTAAFQTERRRLRSWHAEVAAGWMASAVELGREEETIDAARRLGLHRAEEPGLLASVVRLHRSAGRAEEALALVERWPGWVEGRSRPQVLLDALDDRSGTGRPAVRPGRLPAPRDPLIGRAAERLAVVRALASHRVVSLVGPGGFGKTRLALDVAAALSPAYPDGVALVDLSFLADASQVPTRVAAGLGIAEHPRNSPVDRLMARHAESAMLVVLDGCEQVVDGVAAMLAALTARMPALHVLVTSQQPLGVDAERVITLGPMALPPADSPDLDTVASSDAGALLLARLRAAGVSPDDATPADLARICIALDGSPLALRLAAGAAIEVGVAGVLANLDDALDLLRSRHRTPGARHASLRAVVAYGHSLLDPQQQAAIDALAVLAGDIHPEAAEEIAGADQACLRALAVHGWLVPGARGRLRMLRTVTQHGVARLAASGGLAAARRRHLAWVTRVVQARPSTDGPSVPAWVEAVSDVQHEAIAAFQLGRAGELPVEGVQQLAADMGWAWFLTGKFVDGSDQCDRLLGLPGGDTAASRALHATAARLWWARGDAERAAGHAAEALGGGASTASRAAGLEMTGLVRRSAGDPGAALPDLLASLDLTRSSGDRWSWSLTADVTAMTLLDLGRTSEAVGLAEEALQVHRRLADAFGESFSCWNLGRADLLGGHLARAADHLAHSVAVAASIGQRAGVHVGLVTLAHVAHAGGDTVRAERLLVAAGDVGAQMHFPLPGPEEAAARRLAVEVGVPWGDGRGRPGSQRPMGIRDVVALARQR